MTTAAHERRERIQTLEQKYLTEIDVLKKRYRSEIQDILKNIEHRKLDSVRKKLKK